MRVLHWDKKRDSQIENILPDWRRWATNHGYFLVETAPLSCGSLSILFEIYQHQNPQYVDTYLLYHPPIGETRNTEVLCILPNKAILDQILEAEKQMALSVMKSLEQDEYP